MHHDLTTVEVVGLAIRSEEDAAYFYGHIARIVKNELVRSKYEELAREEGRHRKLLTALYKKMTGDDNPPKKIPDHPETAEGRLSPDSEDMEELLNIAISREQEASKFYKDASVNASDMAAQRTLEYLSNIEHGHELMIKSELEAFLRDRDWYANNPEIQLLG